MTTASAKSAWKHWIQAGIIILVLTLLDQVSKHLVLTYLKGENDISLISDISYLNCLLFSYIDCVVFDNTSSVIFSRYDFILFKFSEIKVCR